MSTARATAATTLAVVGVAFAVGMAAWSALSGAPLLLVLPIAGATIMWLALHHACAHPSHAADAGVLLAWLAVAALSVLLISFGGATLWLPMVAFALSGALLPR